jgi:single-stranded-DNA-specific exonuclease
MRWDIAHRIQAKKRIQRREEIVAAILQERDITTKKARGAFLQPSDPMEITLTEVGIDEVEVKKAQDRIEQAIKDRQPVIVYGDYDADGITATAILWETLHQKGAQAHPFIPSRERHGYGLSVKGMEDALKEIESAVKPLVITVDNGIVAHEAAEYLKDQGIDLILTDHHQKSDTSPYHFALIHTDTIAGSGVAWMLAKALSREQAVNTLELVTIGTVADMLPLTGANRSIVKAGLPCLRNTKRPGLRALYDEAGVDDEEEFSTYHVNYIIAPRLNAMGRLEHALDSLRLLCTHDEDRAKKLAATLGETNSRRQDMTFEYVGFAHDMVGENPGSIIVLDHHEFHEGVIGLVAGKLVETYYRPSIVISRGEEISKASARSISGVNIIELIRRHEDLLINAGGHPMAAGFSLETAMIPQFIEKISQSATELIAKEQLEPLLKVDVEIRLNDIDDELYLALDELKPFGMANPRPVFATDGARLVDAKLVGKNQNHLKLILQDETGSRFHGIGFGLGEQSAVQQMLRDGIKRVDIAYTIDENVWNGRRSLQLRVKDIKNVE